MGAMDHEPRRDKTRTCYFGNVKTRLGSKLPATASQPLHVSEPPWETQPQARVTPQPTSKPLNHTPHIRNPKLRQYYLQGPSCDLSSTTVNPEQTGGLSANSTNKRQLVMPHGKNSLTTEGLSRTELDTDPKPRLGVDPDSSDTLSAHPHSPSPEAEYDKLLDVEAVPMPDGQLCLLALPPECCQGEGPEATPYLKLFCRYITDRKGVVSGILLVTSEKIFFDPCKTHPLVKEHGCEEYLLSFSVSSLASVAFFSDISHVHFSSSQQRKKGKKIFQTKSRVGRLSDHKGEPAHSPSADGSRLALGTTKGDSSNKEDEDDSRDMAEAEREFDSSPPEASVGVLGAAVLNSAATFCCGGQEARSLKTETSSVRAGSPGTLMFVRLRVQLTAGKKKSLGGVQLGMNKPLPRKDAWLALSQESSDELHAHLMRCRPDLSVLDGGEEEGEVDEEEFVLIEDRDGDEKEEEEMLHRHRSSGDDWEMVLMEESGERPTTIPDRDPEGLANILDNSHILEASHVKELCKELPPRTVGHTWQLAYSTFRHGASLKSLYRRLSATDSPVLLVIKDALDEIFGAFLSDPLRPSEVFYGTGETFLFMLHPRFKCFRWTGENSFFIKGDLDSFSIGGGRGHFGLWLDENLYLGRSSPCYTFNNCCLSETDDFRVMELEVWTFG